ncbi:MAG: general secretion pathway protein GspK [Planctomycetaceae bacterium]|nr:general secretion pathway protein GspK [Planctomycetaceae bacterium]
MRQRLTASSAERSSRRGFVLVVIMVLVVSVAFAGFAFVQTMSNEYRAVHIDGDLLEAEQVLASADVMVRHFIDLSHEQRDEAGGWSNNPELFQNQVIAQSTDEEVSESDDSLRWRFSVVSPPDDAPSLLETTGVRSGLENESAKLNLGNLINLELEQQNGGRLALMQLPGMTEIAADSIMDWIDADDVAREFGAESEFYRELPNPYRPRNALPTSLDELLLVRGVHRILLYGADRNLNFRIDADEREVEALTTQLVSETEDNPLPERGWASMVTLHSAERNVDRTGEPRFNLNNPNLSELHASLSEVLPVEMVEFIIRWRQYGPATASTSSPPATSVSLDLTIPAVFEFVTPMDIVEVHTYAAMMPAPIVVPSPVLSSSIEEINLLLDHTTVRIESVLRNRININLASPAVLRTIPHMTDELVDRLVNTRETLDNAARQSAAWLLTEQVLSLETFRAVLPFVTTGGDVFRAQVIAWRPVGGPSRRVELLLNGATETVGRIRWRDLTSLGVGFPVSQLSSARAESPFAGSGFGP